MFTENWSPSKRRVAIHEIGHVLIDYLLTQQTAGAMIYFDGVAWAGQAYEREKKATKLAPPEDWHKGVVIFYGGWAAVHVAINKGHLERESVAVEAVPGDHGFLGVFPADEGLVAWAASRADSGDPDAAAARAKADALHIIEENFQTVLTLADHLEVAENVIQHDVEVALRRFQSPTSLWQGDARGDDHVNDTPVRSFAIEKDPDDGFFYLHTDRVLAPNGRDFNSNKLPLGFPTKAAAREHAHQLGAADCDIAPSQGSR